MKNLSYLLTAVSLACLAFLVPASAKIKKYEDDVQRTPVSQKSAVQIFWRFSNCAARRDMDGARALLETRDWDSDVGVEAAAYTKKHRSCLSDGSRMRFQPDLFRQALAAAYLMQKYKKMAAPEYGYVNTFYTKQALNAADTEQKKATFLLRSFADCIVRNKPQLALNLFSSKPHSKDEAETFAEINPILGACLPVKPGQQVKFTRMSLRGLMAEAAYDLDLRYVDKSADTTEAKN